MHNAGPRCRLHVQSRYSLAAMLDLLTRCSSRSPDATTGKDTMASCLGTECLLAANDGGSEMKLDELDENPRDHRQDLLWRARQRAIVHAETR